MNTLMRTDTEEPGWDLEGLFSQHAPKLLRAASRVTGDLSDAEDVLQTIFLRLHRKKPRPAGEAPPAAYLYRAVVNGALDVMRSRQRAQEAGLREIGPQIESEDDSATPDRILEAREKTKALRRALSVLSEKSAEIFVLRYFEGLTNTEVAEVTGTSANVVGVLLHRARHRLEKELS